MRFGSGNIQILITSLFQDNFKKIPIDIRKCNFPDEGSLELFDYYTESNCQLECAWREAADICGCKPWYVPSTGEEMCFVLGNVCFDQIMKKIESGDKKLGCECAKDCVYSRYSMSLTDRIVMERLSSRKWTNETFGEGFYKIGTDEQDGNDFSGSHWYNLGKNILSLKS